MTTARQLWTRLETIHAVTYFAPESRAAADACGLRGFWMGYFAFRAAPLGAVGPDVVTAAFFNFAPGMVQRAIPDAWDRAGPAVLLDARRTSAAAALRRVASEVERLDRDTVVELMHAAGSAPTTAPDLSLGSANRRLGVSTDVVEAVWQQCTTMREHRGDAHVAALRAAGIDGCEAHLLLAADQGVPEALLRDNRGWSAMEWEMARAALVNRGFITSTGAVTPDGRATRGAVEAATDARAADLFADVDADALQAALDPVARTIAASGLIPYPNPMGLPRVA